MRILTLDIETITPRWEPPEDDPGKFPGIPFHEPCVVCWMIHDKQGLEINMCDIAEFNERDILEELRADLQSSDRLVTFNGRGFDMPVLAFRAMTCGLDWSWWCKVPKGRTNVALRLAFKYISYAINGRACLYCRQRLPLRFFVNPALWPPWRFNEIQARCVVCRHIESSVHRAGITDRAPIDRVAIARHLYQRPPSESIDHIVPLSAFDLGDPRQVHAAFAPENHQWLSKTDNSRKGTFYDAERKNALMARNKQLPLLWPRRGADDN